tara:strand:- start:1348 stop:1827 length:480 start_codon:yes stop_codon:yes gene_type:complete
MGDSECNSPLSRCYKEANASLIINSLDISPLPENIINIIEPYTRRPQSKKLLYDIRNYTSTLLKVELMYYSGLRQRYHLDYEAALSQTYNTFYNELVKGLYLIDREKLIYLYYKLHGNTTRISRAYWGQLEPSGRYYIVKGIQKYFHNPVRRPGDYNEF